MRLRFSASPNPPTWAIVAWVTVAHGALAWGLLHWTAAPIQALPPTLSVQWLAEPTAQAAQPTRATPEPRPKPPPTALAIPPATAKVQPPAQAPSVLPQVAPSNPLAAANTPALAPAKPSTQVNNATATGQPNAAAAPAPMSGLAAAPNLLGTAPPNGVTTGVPTSANKNVPSGPATSPRFDAAYLHNPKPNYPTRSRQLGETGTVVLKVRVEANGQASQVLLNKSSGYERLDAAALDSVKQWRFVPAQEGNQAVGAWVFVPVPFGLE